MSLDADVKLAGLVHDFVERATAASLGEVPRRDLARAAEEVFTYVAEQSPGVAVRFRLEARPYAALLDAEFEAARFSPGAFNLTHAVDPDDEALADLPLLMAARSVDRFDLSVEAGDLIRIQLQKDRVYAALPPATPPSLDDSPGGSFTCTAGTPELLRYFAARLAQAVAPALVPGFARNGDRLADLAAAGEVSSLLALDAGGRIGGGLLWRVAASGLVANFYGPYMLAAAPRDGIATALVEGFIAAVSRGRLHGVFSRHVPPDLPAEYFEPLGSLAAATPDVPEVRAVYRGLQEDQPAAIWGDPAIIPYLEERYAELALAREIRPVRPAQGTTSVLSVGFDRMAATATLHPVLAGQDAAANVAAHAALLAREPMLLAHLDLGRSIDATFIPALLAAGFVPRFLVPSAATGDVLVMQRAAPAP